MKKLWSSFKIAFSMYSKIPMSQENWTEENMRYMMCFLPWIGIVIAILEFGWRWIALKFGITENHGIFFYGAVLTLIPVAVTGGIHLDGFLDTSDAMASWQTPEKRLEILKDSNAGAFAIIMGCSYFILSFASYTALDTEAAFRVFCLNFILSRTLGGLSVVTFPMAKNTGLASAFSDWAQKKIVAICMIFYFLLICLGMLYSSPVYGIVAISVSLLFFGYYHHFSCKNFGGITGDLAGWSIQILELAVPFGLCLAQYFFH